MDLWRGHIGAAALFDWTQNPDVLALLASGTYWHYSQAGCVPRDGTTITTERGLEKNILKISRTDIPLGFATPHVNHMCAFRPIYSMIYILLGPAGSASGYAV